MVTLIGHLAMGDAGWAPAAHAAGLAAFGVITLAQAQAMVRHGPRVALTSAAVGAAAAVTDPVAVRR